MVDSLATPVDLHDHVGVREPGETPGLTRSGVGDGRGNKPLGRKVWEGVPTG